MNDPTAAPDQADRLADVYDLVGPLYRRAQRRVELDVPAEGLSVGVRAVLSMLYRHGPMTVPQMGRAQAISRQFVQRMVNEAAARGLVESFANPAHKKSSLIRLTELGCSAIDAVLTREADNLRRVGEHVTEDDIDACLRVLSALLAGLDDVDVDIDVD